MARKNSSATTWSPPQARAKIDDVAREAGVSSATVSRVLNHPAVVRPELRDKVARAIAKLAYTRDSAGRALKSGRMRTIGAVVPTLGLSIFAEGIEALQNRLSEAGYTLLIGNAQYDQQRELQELRSLLERGIDGVALVGGSHSAELRAMIGQAGVPVITTYVSRAPGGMPSIGIDNEAAMREITRHLLEMGHLCFGVIANVPPANDRSRARLEGAQKALAQAGIELKPTQIIKADYSLAQGRNAFRQLVADHPEITAVICTADTLAIGAIAEARALGFKVPQTLSITGFDDIELAAQLDPPLTTVGVPAGEIGRGAADYLINAVSGLSVPRNIQLPYRIIMRSSTGPVPPSSTRKSAKRASVKKR